MTTAKVANDHEQPSEDDDAKPPATKRVKVMHVKGDDKSDAAHDGDILARLDAKVLAPVRVSLEPS